MRLLFHSSPTTLLVATSLALVAVSVVGLTISSPQAGSVGDTSQLPTPAGMVLVRGGTFHMGFAKGHADEAKEHPVTIGDFYLDRTEVSNREFAEFVADTGHITQAEKDGAAWVFLQGNTDFVFLEGAHWRQPFGAGSHLDDRMDHPVVCVSWEDATSYAAWAGKRLPTEAEWEFAARNGGGAHVRADVEGANLSTVKAANAEHQAAAEHNVWQGTWPNDNKLADEHYYTAAVTFGDPNEMGIYNMIGNVWEWAADWYDAKYYEGSPLLGPRGPAEGTYRVARGGSWFCSPNYCAAYSSHYRGASPPTSTFNNVGFRCAADAPHTLRPTLDLEQSE